MISDRYEVGEIVGTGAFATVHQAVDQRLHSTVAIKVLAENWAADPAVCERFGREATLLRRVRSSHRNAPLAEVFDIDQTEDGRPYFVMSFADRGTLASRWAVGAPWPVARVLPVVETLADGLHALHSAGVVHRDIKPSNLLYVSQPGAADGEELLIGDLGLAKDTLTATSNLTVAGGTPGYMAPEQRYPDSTITPAADVYSATIVVAELLSGRRGDASIASLPPTVQEVFATGAAAEPAERHQDIRTWRDQLVAALGAIDDPTELSSASAPVSNAVPASGTSSGNRRVMQLMVAGVAVLIAVSIGIGVLLMALGGSSIDIDGPATASVGETVFFRPDIPDDARSHFWTVAGQRVDDADLQLTPSSAGRVVIELSVMLADGSTEATTQSLQVTS